MEIGVPCFRKFVTAGTENLCFGTGNVDVEGVPQLECPAFMFESAFDTVCPNIVIGMVCTVRVVIFYVWEVFVAVVSEFVFGPQATAAFAGEQLTEPRSTVYFW